MNLNGLGWIGLLASLGLLASAAEAQASALDPAALAALHRMADRLRGLSSLRVVAQVEYDALQRDGQTVEFGSTREIAVRRPDHVRAHATDRSGAERSLYYDGRQIVVFDSTHAVYATAEQAGDIDAVLRFSEEELGVPVPLGDLLASDLGTRLDESLVSAAVVGEESIDGVRCDHLVLRNADRGIQLWIEQGETALPRRISITWEQAPGRPQFRAQMARWELDPELLDSVFVFEAPEGAERVRFHVRPAAPSPPGGH